MKYSDSSVKQQYGPGLREALNQSGAFRRLDPQTQKELRNSLEKVSGAINTSRAMAPANPGGQGNPAPAAPGQGSAGGGNVDRVGAVASATLNAIDFPSFVSSLIQGTFQAIVNASIQQMESYAELIKNVAGTVDQFMQDNVSDDNAKDYLVDKYPDMFYKETDGNRPRMGVARQSNTTSELPSFFKDMGISSPAQITEPELERKIIPSTRRHLAELRHQTLSTMVLMGLQRIVVEDGEINAKLQFHIDASEALDITFDQTKTGQGQFSRGGKQPFSATGIMVNTMNMNAQSDINVRADLTGEVKVKFKTDYMPLERFADSHAIQLINSHAKVPDPQHSQPKENSGSDNENQGGDNPSISEEKSFRNDPWAPGRGKK